MDNQQALDRYRYMLKSAPPDDIERAHAEAFAQLTPEQRRTVLAQLSQQVPPSEVAPSDDPTSLARMATRAEMRQPGTMERTFSQVPAGPGLGGMFLSTIAGVFVGTAIADAFFGDQGQMDGDTSDPASDQGSNDDFGDTGGDLGGGDLGAGLGDFGGGDFGGF